MLRTKPLIALVGLVLLTTAAAADQTAPATAAGPVLVVDTVKGTFEIETLPGDAPKSVAKIVDLVKANFYRGLRVHSMSPGVIEFGDPSSRNMQKMADWGYGGSGKKIGVQEVSKRSFVRGIVGFSYPKDGKPEDADSHLFVLKVPSPSLNGKHAVIGRVTKGMEVVDKLNASDVIRNITIKP
jgi:peptidyl-prolyl cis-trans isomerase B (cyclophilin B)